jgi:hypothetical protein
MLEYVCITIYEFLSESIESFCQRCNRARVIRMCAGCNTRDHCGTRDGKSEYRSRTLGRYNKNNADWLEWLFTSNSETGRAYQQHLKIQVADQILHL